ncbi:MAG: prepilin-type N-terminal cleavage/methylation domain-containing protein [Puniceicoccales bacterium]|jgi:hypothetical protein|nr:prepilin-type N-terminal cleavage/methylation domain-containing protein [Puniceicoccales bacterium]
MRVWKNVSGFTLLEFLVASALTVLIATAAILGVNAVLDYKKNETMKPKLIWEANSVLDGIEKDFDNKCTSLGNLLCREQSYPFQYFPTQGPIANYPSLLFFVNAADGPQLLCYSLGRLPSAIGGDNTATSPCGLFKLIKDVNASAALWQNFESIADLHTEFNGGDVAKLAHLISESVVLFEVHLVKFQADGISLDYLNTDAQLIKINTGQGVLNANNINLKDLAFTEITVGVLSKSQHKEYFSLTGDQRKTFLAKNGAKLSRLLPWRI